MEINLRKIGTRIAQRRKELGYTQQKLAEKLNISFQAVSKWENGSASPDISLLPEIAYILNTTVDAMVGYRHQPFTDYEEKYNRSSCNLHVFDRLHNKNTGE